MPVLVTLLTILGLIGPAVLLGWLTHRFLVPVPRLTIGLAIVLSFLAVAPGLIPGLVPVPVDEVARGFPIRGVAGELTPANPITNDTTKLFLPWYDAARAQILSGDLPLWNPWSFSGYPLLANGEAAPLSPFFVLTLFVPLPSQIVAMAGLKVFVAILFGALFLERIGAGRWAALFGAVAFALSVYQFVYLYYSASTVSALMPAVAFGLVLILDSPGFRSSSFFAIVVGVAMSSGHPETVVHIVLGGLIVIAARLIAGNLPDLRRSFLIMVGGSLLGLLVSLVAWVPVAEQVTRSQRLGEISGEREMNEPFSGLAAWAVISPEAFGNPGRDSWGWKYSYPGVASSYAGAIVLILLPAALLLPSAGPIARTLAIGSIATWLLAMKWSPIGMLADLPPLSLMGNDKLRFVSVFLAASAAALVLERLTAARRWIWVIAPAIGFLGAWFWIARHYYPERMGGTSVIGPIAVIAILCAALGLPKRLAMVAFAAVTVELLTLNLPYNAPVDAGLFRPDLPIVEKARELAPEEPFRIAGLDWTFLPNTSALYRLEDVRGSDPMAWQRYVEYLSRFSIPTDNADVRRIVDASRPELDHLGVRFMFAEPDQNAGPGWRKVYEGPDGRLFENEEWSRRFFEQGHADGSAPDPAIRSLWIGEAKPGRFRLTVDAARAGLIESSQPALPGWRVEIDGVEVEVKVLDGTFIGFDVPAGTSKIVVDYRPASVTISLWVSIISLLAWIAVMRWSGRASPED